MNTRQAGDLAEERIRACRLLAIIRSPQLTEDYAAELTATLVEAGIGALEFTLDSVGALGAIQVARDVARDRAAIGAGTVLRPEAVEHAAQHGAQFIVSPDVCPEVIASTAALGLLAIPGAFTATEVRRAVAYGARLVKLFPAQPSGAAYLAALRTPLPDVAFVPTGGVTIAQIPEFLAAGAVAVALGSALVPSMDDGAELRSRARRAVAAAARSGRG